MAGGECDKRQEVLTMDAEPQLLEVGLEVFDLDFHPSQDLIGLGLVDGQARIYAYEGSGETCTLKQSLSAHSDACRAIVFDPAGTSIYTGSTDRSVRMADLETGKDKWSGKEHEDAVNCITYSLEHSLLVSGDDSGVVKLWDTRKKTATATLHANEDFIADVLTSQDLMFSASGDNTLAVYSLKQRKLITRSMDQEDELLSLLVVKGGKKLVAGTQSGVLLFYNWNEWHNCSDRFVGHPETVEAMVKVDEETILTGSSDGLIRLCSLFPNKLLGVMGAHDDFPVEGLKMSRDNRLLASIAHDEVVRLWDMSDLDGEEGDDEDEKGSADDDDSDDEGVAKRKGTVAAAAMDGSGEDDAEEEDADDDDEEADDSADGDDDDEDDDDDDDDASSQEEEEEEEEAPPSVAERRALAAAAAAAAAARSGKKGGKGAPPRAATSSSNGAPSASAAAAGGKKKAAGKAKEDDSSDDDDDSSSSDGGGGKGHGGAKRARLATPAESFFKDL